MRERRGQPIARLSILAALVVAGFGVPATGHAAEPDAAGDTDAVVEMVNEERESAGCAPVTVDPDLTAAAQDHAQDQADQGEMSHVGSDGSKTGERAERAGYEYSTIAENVAYGTTSAERVMEMWMESSGHRENILNCDYEDIGVGEVDGFWTQTFATPK